VTLMVNSLQDGPGLRPSLTLGRAFDLKPAQMPMGNAAQESTGRPRTPDGSRWQCCCQQRSFDFASPDCGFDNTDQPCFQVFLSCL